MNPTPNLDTPITDFSGCHIGIIQHFNQLKTLPDLLGKLETFEEARELAGELRQFFKKVVLPHHEDEEHELFPIVIDALDRHPEQAMLAKGYIGRLIHEHRHLERSWKTIDKTLKRITKGKVTELNIDSLSQFATDYIAHAKFEEQYFLPLAEQILSQSDQEKLGMSLHVRHLDIPAQMYI